MSIFLTIWSHCLVMNQKQELIDVAKAPGKLNQLNKVNHHKNKETALELSNVIFYFEQDPIINLMQQVVYAPDREEHVFFFPMTEVKSNVQQMIAKVNSETSAWYTLHIEPVIKPIKGVKFVIQYNPQKVGFSYDTFDTISMQKGIVFRFHNQALLKTIRKKGRDILNTAHVSGLPRIVIDSGHGGGDFGAVICDTICEKNICLSIGLQLAQLLREEGVVVFLTRDGDYQVALEDRTSFANQSDGDLFISIHANTASQSSAAGIETYCITDDLFKKKMCSVDQSDDSLLNKALSDRYASSNLLAYAVHTHVVNSVRKLEPKAVDRHVKHAVSQVLTGAMMPAILVEVGFLTNKDEVQHLQDPPYQQKIAQGIHDGVMAYVANVEQRV